MSSIITPQLKKMTPQVLAGLGMVKSVDAISPKLMVCSSGHEKRGKTHWAFTAPGPIGCIYTDTGTKEIAAKFTREGKDVYLFHYTVPDKDETTTAKESEWKKVKKTIREIATSGYFRTLVGDTGTEVWETLRMARFGKLTQVMPHNYTEANSEMNELLKVVAESDINSIWIHKVKKEYKGNKAGDKEVWTGKYERSGFSSIGYLADVVLEHDRIRNGNDQLEFGIRIIDSRYEAPSLVGADLTGGLCNFETLALSCFPETDPDYWE